MLHEDLARPRQTDGMRAARALDQLLADDALERRDLLADGRLRVPERGRGADERCLVRDRIEGEKMAELDAQPPRRPVSGVNMSRGLDIRQSLRRVSG